MTRHATDETPDLRLGGDLTPDERLRALRNQRALARERFYRRFVLSVYGVVFLAGCWAGALVAGSTTG